MSGELVSIGWEIADSHFIDQDQAELQIDNCAAHLKEEEARGRPVAEARRCLERAREFLSRGLFTRAFFLALKARGVALERVS